MANRTAWTPGNFNSGGWTAAFNNTDLASLANGSSVLSSVADIANATNLDQFMDISMELLIASSTIVAGATMSFYIYALLDGGAYGDGQLVAGTQKAATPVVQTCAPISIPPVAATTAIYGFYQGLLLPPGSFRLAANNLIGFALTSGTQTVKVRTYNINLNN
jgi:hypothetical protein